MGSSGGSSEHFLRQFSASDGAPLPRELGEEWAAAECGRRGSRRWSRKKARGHHRRGGGGGGGGGLCRSRGGGPRGEEAGDGGGGPELRCQARHDVGAHPRRQQGGLPHPAPRPPPRRRRRLRARQLPRLTLQGLQARGGGLGACDPRAQAGHRPQPGEEAGCICAGAEPMQAISFLLLHEEQRRGVRGGVHQQGGLPDAGGEAAEQGRRRLPHQHPVAEELLAAGLTNFYCQRRASLLLLQEEINKFSD
ncbi:hypothetical protein OsJ_18624 [Oryza sativa Japonica Group]|uniref:Uncharacterized protein n=1 Tax=Oryza sativa subsp. japonica TaxID=39947 RepID=B9FIX8_ORYSJ|nr:hypothetical protein OsJ_18624 [Oryza sativa Japonica Group]